MVKFGDVKDFATIGLIAGIGFVGLQAIGGIEGIKDIFGGLAGTPGAIAEGLGQAGSSFFSFFTPNITLSPEDQANLRLQQDIVDAQKQASQIPGQDFGISPGQQVGFEDFFALKRQQFRADFESGLIDQSTFDLLNADIDDREQRLASFQDSQQPVSPPGIQTPPPSRGGSGRGGGGIIVPDAPASFTPPLQFQLPVFSGIDTRQSIDPALIPGATPSSAFPESAQAFLKGDQSVEDAFKQIFG